MTRLHWFLGFLAALAIASGLQQKQAEQAQINCVAEAVDHTDFEVEQRWEVCEKLLAHRRMIGR